MSRVRSELTLGLLTGLSIAADAVAYIVTGTVPDVLVWTTTAIVGGYLGATVPRSKS